MNEIIRKRKSVRKYDMTELDTATLEKVRKQIESVVPLYPDIRYSIEITNKTKTSITGVKAPHFLLFFTEEKEGAYENIGFIGQQIGLFLLEAGLGSCWLGVAKPKDTTLPYVIAMAFGKPDEPLHRDISEFKRKPLAEIREGSDDRLEAARLAPNAVNAQNWYFITDSGKIHCYRKKPNPLLGFILNNMSYIDMGIALWHIATESSDFRFAKETNAPARKDCIYMGTVG